MVKIDHQKIVFNRTDHFLGTVRQRVDDYFVKSNISRHATWSIYLKSILLFTFCLLVYCSLILDWFPAISREILWLFLGIGEALFAINVGHDALHGSFSKSARVNRYLGYLGYDLLGLSSFVWKQTHNKEHHTYTNISGVDPDINKPVLLRLSPHDPYYRFHAFQFIYIWFLYSLLTLNWVLFSDYAFMAEHKKEVANKDLVIFGLFKLFNLMYMILIPLVFSSMAWWEVGLGYLTAQLIAGIIVSLIFQLAHLVEGLEFPLPNQNGLVESSWGTHEMATTANFSTNSRTMGHLTGGLNFQIEHHLLPHICHVHYYEISPIIKKAAKEFNLSYHERPSLSSAVSSHVRLLKILGKKPKILL